MNILRLFLLSAALLALTSRALSQPATGQPQPGSILCAYWRELPGSAVADLTSTPAYPNFPHEQILLDRFELPENQQGEFGATVRGFILPPQDGTYTFSIASTNEGQLWLAERGASQPSTLVAHVPEWCSPRDWSAGKQQPVVLKKGEKYFLEARFKNGGGDNHLSVAWKLPDGTIEGPIPGARLTPAVPVVVAPPKATLPALPTEPGPHLINVPVEYLAQTLVVPLKLTLPDGYQPGRPSPAIVHISDPDAPLDLAVAMPAATKGVILISPELPEGRSYDQRLTTKASAAAVQSLCDALAVDRAHLGLTGHSAGGTAAWRIAIELPGFFTAFSPVNALEVVDPRLKQSLTGTQVRLYTDIDDGFATGRANNMLAALDGNIPSPQIIYLSEKELAGTPASQYCYARPDFYNNLLSIQPPSTAPTSHSAARRWIVSILFAAVIFAYLLWRTAHPAKRKKRLRMLGALFN